VKRRIIAAIVGAAAFAAVALAAGPIDQPPRAYYLALGDSIAYGIQPDKVSSGLPPTGYTTGYVDDFAAHLRKLSSTIRVVNYSCPGESTTTFVHGGCPWLAEGKKLHDAFRGSQLNAALAFLHARNGQVSPITVTLGANDVTQFADSCNGNRKCFQARAPQALVAFGGRLASILARLRAAAPTAEIIVTGTWNETIADLPHTNPLYQALDNTIAKAAQSARAHFADTLPVFNPRGTTAEERARICAYTFICSQGDGHPTDTGYRAIADTVLAASSYHS
jgi:lysophospholipase L1-like esterase